MLERVTWRTKLLPLAGIVAMLTYLGRHMEIDDALIYARYIGNALAGRGLVFNVGEHVNALTSPFFAYLLLSTSWVLKGNVLLATVLLSGIFLFLAVALAERLVPLAGFVIASTSFFYTLIGMESALFLFMLILLLTLYLEHRDNWIPLASILLILTRYEGAAMVLAIAVAMYRARRVPRLLSLLPVALIGGLYCWLNYHWYNSVIPSSATSKIGQGMSRIWGHYPLGFFAAGRALIPDFMPIIYLVLLGAIGTFYTIRRGLNKDMNYPVLGFCGIAMAFYIVFNIPGYRWYYAPFVFFGIFLGCQAIPKTSLFRWGSLAVTSLVLATSIYVFFRAPYDPHGGYIGLAEWLNANTSPTSRIEASETGTLGLFAPDRYIIDIIGLTTPKNAVHIAHRDQSSWLPEDHPDYIVVHDMDWSWERVAKQSSDYVPIGEHFGTAYILERRSLVEKQ